MIQNPIFKGFNPDPCICRKNDDYYAAVSSFEWFPGIPVYHSRDLKNWELYTHVLTDDKEVELRKLPSAKGIWAPCLTYCEAEDLFYVVYGVMNSMNARYFDVDNFLITAKDIRGPWSRPVYLNSAGFDASLFHDDDGRKYVVSLEWETREGYEKPGEICMVEYDPEKQEVMGHVKRIWRGGTDRGCIEAPHLTKRGEYYYIMCAEGGTGYNHCVTMGRSKNVWGPYEKDPMNPIVTSQPGESYERHDPDHLKPKYYNPDSILQKSGHELGAEVVVPPLERQVEVAGKDPQHTVVVLLPLDIHGAQPLPQTEVGLLAHLQLIEAAGDRPAVHRDLFLHQAGGEGQIAVLSGKAVKGAAGAVQADGGVGEIVPGGEVDQPGKPGLGPGQ